MVTDGDPEVLDEAEDAQTAAALGVPAGTVKSRLSRALAQLSADRHLAEVGSPRKDEDHG